MKKTIILFAIPILMVQTCFARLGESPAECARRYGNPVERIRLPNDAGYEYRYERGNYEIAIRFVRTSKTIFQRYSAGYISFAKKDHSAFDRKTVETILNKNLPDQILYSRMSRDMFWEEVEDIEQENIDKEWVRRYRYSEFKEGKQVEETGYAEARANLSDDNVLVITSHFPLPRGYKTWEKRQEALEEMEQSADATRDDFF